MFCHLIQVLPSNPISYIQLVVVHSSIFCIIHCVIIIVWKFIWRIKKKITLCVMTDYIILALLISNTQFCNCTRQCLHEFIAFAFNWPCSPILTYFPWKGEFLFNIVDNGINSSFLFISARYSNLHAFG